MGVVADDRVHPRAAAVHGILFGALYDGGGAWTVSQYGAWLEAAGCGQVEADWLDDGRGAIRAVRR